MQASTNELQQLCYSVRLIAPFIRVLRQTGISSELLDPLEAIDPDERLPIATVHDLLGDAIELTGNPNLGLAAAHEIRSGEYGVLEYVARSAQTWDAALAAVGRYMRLLNDALTFDVSIQDDRAFIRLGRRIEMPRAAVDFQSAAFMISGWSMCATPHLGDVEVWFTHARPECAAHYERTFRSRIVRFDAPFDGFTFASAVLAEPMVSFDIELHKVVRQYADLLLTALPRTESLSEQVQHAIAPQLQSGKVTLSQIALQLRLTPSTLIRRLEREGTSFQSLLDDLRCRLAKRYILSGELSLTEIAFLLGFSQSAPFHRAFKRWTSQTPLEYRQSNRSK